MDVRLQYLHLTEKEIKLCAKFASFSVQNFAFWMQNLRSFNAKNRGESNNVRFDDSFYLIRDNLQFLNCLILFAIKAL